MCVPPWKTDAAGRDSTLVQVKRGPGMSSKCSPLGRNGNACSRVDEKLPDLGRGKAAVFVHGERGRCIMNNPSSGSGFGHER